MQHNGYMMVTNLSLVQGAPGELYSLFDWLQRNDEFRGRIKPLSQGSAPQDMGGTIEVLSVVLGSGGAGAVLVSSLSTWLQTRRARISVEVVMDESGDTVRKLEVDASSAAAVKELYGLLASDKKRS